MQSAGDLTGRRVALAVCFAALSWTPGTAFGQKTEAEPFQPRLLIAFSAYRPRPKYPTIYFYHHDGESRGKIVGSVEVSGKRSDTRASLSHDGRYCAFASEQENQPSKVALWSLPEKRLVDLPGLNESPHAQLQAALSGDGNFFAFAAWSHPQARGRWDILVYDVGGKRRLPLPGLNSQPHDERMPAFSADGRLLAFTSNANDGAGGTDIFFYDVDEATITRASGLNSPQMELEPSVSADGNLIAFSSDRPGGEGGRDIYLYDRKQGALLPLPGLNYVAHEQSPSISPDGRYIVFVSERLSGEGERDVFLYDRQRQRLLPTPDLNGVAEDMDPCVIVLPSPE